MAILAWHLREHFPHRPDSELLSGYNYTTSLFTRHAKVASLIIDRYTASAAASLESLVDASISYLQPHLTSFQPSYTVLFPARSLSL